MINTTHVKNECRICFDSVIPENLISLCNNRGCLRYVHKSCLINWLKTSKQDHFNLCQLRFGQGEYHNSSLNYQNTHYNNHIHHKKIIMLIFSIIFLLLLNSFKINLFMTLIVFQFLCIVISEWLIDMETNA